MTVEEWQVPLWDAIHRYVVACGGDPGEHVHENTARMDAVVEVIDVVRGVRSSQARTAAKDDLLPAYRKRPALTRLQSHWMLMRAVMGNGDVSKRAMAEWQGDVAPDPETLEPPPLLRDRAL